jgi:hypothetical protein
MRKLLFIFIFSFSISGVFAQAYKMPADTEFFYLYGGNNPDEARCIKETPDGGYIIAGTSSSFGPGDASVYLIKTDSLGKHLWSNTYGGTQNDWGYSVEVTADSGFFVSGYSNSFNPPNGYDAYYFKTDKNGTLIWQKIVSGSDWDFIYGSVAMPDGGFILCGETYTNSNGGTDAYLIRLNKSGDTLWTKHYGGLFDETFNSVTLINQQIYAVGKNATFGLDTATYGWIVKLDTNGTVLKDRIIIDTPYHHFEVILAGITPYTNSVFHFCGRTVHPDSNNTTSLIGQADTALNLGWVYIDDPAPSGYFTAYSHVINISNGSICIVGSAIGGLGGQNLFSVGFNLNSGLTFINGFIRHSGGALDDYGYYGIYTTQGRVISVGSSQSFCTGTEDVFLVRFNSDSIQNGPLTTHGPKINCFTDTLYLWQISTRYYNNDIKLKLYPNPATEYVQFEINSNQQKIYTARVYSILGNEITNFKVSSNNNNTLNISGLSEGNYLLKLQDENGQNISILKFVVNK